MIDKVSNSSSASSDPHDPQPLKFVGNHLALNFLNSTAAPNGPLIELIKNGRDFVVWMEDTEAINPTDAAHIISRFPKPDLDRAANSAVSLRERFRGVLTGIKANGINSLSSVDVDHLNEILAQGVSHLRIEDRKAEGLQLRTQRTWKKPDDLLVPLARSMAELLCEGDLNLVRNCENPPCTMWFYDQTKGHRRRWCSQALCGNRAKVAAFRERQKRKAQ